MANEEPHREEITLKVPSKSPVGGPTEEQEAEQKKVVKRLPPKEQSELEKKLQQEFEILARRVLEHDQDALNKMRVELQTATSSVTSVPKPLKFLRHFFDDLAKFHELLPDTSFKRELADVLSVLSAAAASSPFKKERCMLSYRLQGTCTLLQSWGHEYLRNLSSEIPKEYMKRKADGESNEDIFLIADDIVDFYMKHNSECDAVDLLSEIDRLDQIVKFVDENCCSQIAKYILALSNYSASWAESCKMLQTAYDVLMKHNKYTEAVCIVMKMDKKELIYDILKNATDDPLTLKQIAFMCNQHNYPITIEDEEINKLASGECQWEQFINLAKELDVMQPKLPQDVCKTQVLERNMIERPDSAQLNLATTFVNAFVNAAFCDDKLMLIEKPTWLHKHMNEGIMCAAASTGVLLLWNTDKGIEQIDKFHYDENPYVKAGALMAFGLIYSGNQNQCDIALALIVEQLDSKNLKEKLGAILGLGYAYAGTQREELLEHLIPCILSNDDTVECSAMAAISLALTFVGSCNQDVAGVIIDAILEKSTIDLDQSASVFYAVALGLLFFNSRDGCEAILTALETITHPIGTYAAITIEGMAFAGSGDVLKIQKMLQYCIKKKEGDLSLSKADQAIAIINIALISLTEETGTTMTLRMLDHILQHADSHQRAAVPLALALQSISNPKAVAIDTLSKLSHDQNLSVVMNAILGLGFVGAGTNNARIASLLRQLATYYSKDSDCIFTVRIAQGLLYMGKGLLSCNPTHSNRNVLNPVELCSLMIVLHSCIHWKQTILSDKPYLLFHLIPAMHPSALFTVDENLNPLPVAVRVGHAVDTVGQAGHPREITAFQTYTTPVLLQHDHRAEFVTDEYIPLSPILEGVVILKKNPDYVPPEDEKK